MFLTILFTGKKWAFRRDGPPGIPWPARVREASLSIPQLLHADIYTHRFMTGSSSSESVPPAPSILRVGLPRKGVGNPVKTLVVHNS